MPNFFFQQKRVYREMTSEEEGYGKVVKGQVKFGEGQLKLQRGGQA